MVLIDKLVIIGVGLIGGSLALSLKQKGLVGEVVGCDKHHRHGEQALSLGIIDSFESSIKKAIIDADIVVLAVPVGAMPSILNAIAVHLEPKTIVTDVGSVKGQLVTDAEPILKQKMSQLIPGHPIAGTEKSGPSAAFSGLFQEHQVILTPTQQTRPEVTAKITEMWQEVGASVSTMSVHHHDEIMAATSHIPHLLAFSLVDLLAQNEDVSEVLRYAAGGFRDFSRIASSDPVMWRDICLTNREPIITLLRAYQLQIKKIERALIEQDSSYLQDLFSKAKQVRDQRFNQQQSALNNQVASIEAEHK